MEFESFSFPSRWLANTPRTERKVSQKTKRTADVNAFLKTTNNKKKEPQQKWFNQKSFYFERFKKLPSSLCFGIFFGMV
jgi:hypothetical protein